MGKFERSKILSIGTYSPENVMTNADFEKIVNTTDEWIVTRTGIRERHVVPKGQGITTAQLGTNAAREALTKAGITPEAVDGIICATVTPDTLFPSTACQIQAALGCKNAFAFDCLAACAGFVYALTLADNFIRGGQGTTFLIIGSEILTRATDYSDRATCILFGDGAGAAVVQGTNDANTGVLSTHLWSDGTHGDILSLNVWGEDRFMHMEGREVFKHAVRMMTDAALSAVTAARLTMDQIDFLIPHQANIRIIKAVAEHLKVPPQKMVINVEKYGNTSSASIPLALSEAMKEGRIKKGHTIALTSLGGGLAVGSAVVRL